MPSSGGIRIMNASANGVPALMSAMDVLNPSSPGTDLRWTGWEPRAPGRRTGALLPVSACPSGGGVLLPECRVGSPGCRPRDGTRRFPRIRHIPFAWDHGSH